MPIKITQPGEAAAAAKAGAIVGAGKRAQEERARTEREQARAAQEQARAAALQWEQEKMRMRSEQDFQQELAAKQWDYEKFNRAKAWEIEKMEMTSRLDFQQEEKERAEKQAKTAAGLRAIDESDNVYLTPEAKEKAKFDFAFKQEQGYYPPRELREKQNILSLLGRPSEEAAPEPLEGVRTFTHPETKEPIYVPENQPFVTVRHPTLGLKKIRTEQLQEALAEGSVYVPQTQSESITGGVMSDIIGAYTAGLDPEGMRRRAEAERIKRQTGWEEMVKEFRSGTLLSRRFSRDY